MDKSKKNMPSEKARHQRAFYIILFHLYEISMIDKSIELEIQLTGYGAWESAK